MEYLHPSSLPANKSELDIFNVPPTQVAIDSVYETDYRPAASLESSRTYELIIPASEDFTDLSATMLHMNINILKGDSKVVNTTNLVKLVSNFGNALFEQIDLFLGSTNTSLANNMYHYQAYIEDLLYRYPTNIDESFIKNATIVSEDKTYELYYRLHLPLCLQDKLLINGIPLVFRFTRSQSTFPLIRMKDGDKENYSIHISNFTLHLTRVKLFPDAHATIIHTLETHPAKYFITRADTKSFTIPSGVSTMTIENLFVGQLPKRIIIGCVKEEALNGDINHNPFNFENFNINHICLNIDGVIYPSIPYKPDFNKGNCMREYLSLYKALNQDEGIPQIELTYEQYKNGNVLFAFDIGGPLGAESGVLSLIKRGKIRLEIRFDKSITSSIKAIVFGQFDNLITIDKDRQVTIDY
ncbi:uncharacterized protein F54H12.2-like [Panonychus citri]|uniref:uncharacterized protein F54H12.2-like n=1 Tax=Panonychus citri TaxID=50023 RepID=UPI00230792B7|nr:uncharacterized protein F54H12.2-like [Panonychus citri]